MQNLRLCCCQIRIHIFFFPWIMDIPGFDLLENFSDYFVQLWGGQNKNDFGRFGRIQEGELDLDIPGIPIAFSKMNGIDQKRFELLMGLNFSIRNGHRLLRCLVVQVMNMPLLLRSLRQRIAAMQESQPFGKLGQ